MGSETGALTPMLTGGGVFAVLVTVIVYLLIQNGRLTKRLSEVQENFTEGAERRRADAEERAAQRIAELEAMLQLTSPIRRRNDEADPAT